MPTLAPSATNVSAIALPIPLVLPVTRTLAPLSPKSMFDFLPVYRISSRSCFRASCRQTLLASQQELRTDIVRGHVLPGQRPRDLAFFHDVASLGDRHDRIEILLDKNDRRPKFGAER